MSITATRLPRSTFLSKWCKFHGVFFDSESVAIRESKILPTSSTSSSASPQKNKQNSNNKNSTTVSTSAGLGLFAKKLIEPGSFFAIIPKQATLQTSQLANFSVDGGKNRDTSIFPLAVRSIVRGSDSEHPWWELAVLVAMHKCFSQQELDSFFIFGDHKNNQAKEARRKKLEAWNKFILDNNNNNSNSNNDSSVAAGLGNNEFSGYLNFLPPVSPQEAFSLKLEQQQQQKQQQQEKENTTTSKEDSKKNSNSNSSSSIPSHILRDFEFNRTQNMLKCTRLIRDIPLFANHVSASNSSSSSNLLLLSPQTLLWCYEMVTSRANNFSFVNSSPSELRPYGLLPHPIPQQEPTMCPIFDVMNHVKETNVLVADTLVHSKDPNEKGQEKNEEKHEESGENLPASLQLDNFTPSLVLGALRPIQPGEEIGYSYAATPDASFSLTRWGFIPTTF